MQIEKRPRLDIDVNMDLNDLFKSTFGEPIIDVDETMEETMARFFNQELPRNQSHSRFKHW
jgi:hypothetical protein